MFGNIEVQRAQKSRHYPWKSVVINPAGIKKLPSMTRVRFIYILALLLILLVVIRLIYINIANTGFLKTQMNTRIERTVKIPSMRGIIYDRNQTPLAVSTEVPSIWADPRLLDNLTSKDLEKISKILSISNQELNSKFNNKNKTFVYIKRFVKEEEAKQIKELNISGIYILQEYKRFYPTEELNAQVIGITNADDSGIEGIEYSLNNELKGKDGIKKIFRDREGNVIDDLGIMRTASDGENITLSLDSRIQYIALNALRSQVLKFHADGGSAVVLDAKTGEVLSIVNMPTYNPNNSEDIVANAMRNRGLTDLYEPGSTMKPFIVAKALDDKLVTKDTVFNTSPYIIGNKLIKDTHSKPSMTVSQIVEHSSDIGVSKIAMRYQPYNLWEYFGKIGLGKKVGINFPGEAKGIVLNYEDWRPIDQAVMSFGYAVAVSLMQMARAYTIFTNNGCLLPISVLKLDQNDIANRTCTKVIAQSTASTMKDILMKVTEEGTGITARVDGYTTAGKTGTARKINGHGGYFENQHIASFIGFAPVTNPAIIVAIMVDNPHGQYYGTQVAAPVFAEITRNTLNILGIKQDK